MVETYIIIRDERPRSSGAVRGWVVSFNRRVIRFYFRHWRHRTFAPRSDRTVACGFPTSIQEFARRRRRRRRIRELLSISRSLLTSWNEKILLLLLLQTLDTYKPQRINYGDFHSPVALRVHFLYYFFFIFFCFWSSLVY